jgi:flagellar motor protein MotB
MLMAFALNLREAEKKMSQAAKDLTESDLARREMLKDIERMLSGQVPVTVDEQNGTLQLGGDILFPKGSADVFPDAAPKLKTLAYALDFVLPCYAVPAEAPPADRCVGKRKARLEAVYIEGHTDITPVHTARFASNWDLSSARASQTFNIFVASYPTLSRLKNDKGEQLIGVSGYGEFRPIDQSGLEAGMQKNRRIELRFIMVSPKTVEVDEIMKQIDAERKP